ncbi:hypothetical protein [Pseudoalteromonas sp.]|uniref:hypothetical protein n=1 Tax=Pseudoalteromonas sp. TaxID=53249 RepID=UPI001BCEE0C9|nr:hypothetical protein [Pseudoalteromonas sp.]
MIIGNQTATYSQYQSAQQPKAPQKSGNELPDVTEGNTKSRTIDMNNIDVNELNTLIRETGDERLLFSMPFLGQNPHSSGDPYTKKINFIEQIKNISNFEYSLGNTESGKKYEDFLNVLAEYQGYELPPKINIKA